MIHLVVYEGNLLPRESYLILKVLIENLRIAKLSLIIHNAVHSTDNFISLQNLSGIISDKSMDSIE